MDTGGIGRRVAYWRNRRNMTQAEFGRYMGKSRRWVQDLESGQRQVDPRYSVLERAAEVLQVRIESLLSDREVRSSSECVDAAELEEIRAAVHRHDVIVGALGEFDEPPDLDSLRRNVAYGWTAFQSSDYSPLGRVLPPLLVSANRASAALQGDRQRTALTLLSLTYQLTSAIAIKFDDVSLAWHAADRSVIAADRSGDPLTMGGAARHLCDAMLHRNQGAAAVDFAVAVAERLEGDLIARGSQGLSVLGMLYLKASIAAAQIEAHRQVPELLDEADESARRLGDGNALWTAFGPTNVALHRVSALVRLREGREAVTAADGIDPTARDALPRERRTNHMVDIAHGLAYAGNREAAVDKLLDAEREAPEEVHCRPRSRHLISDLRLLGVGSADGRLQALAQRCGLRE